MKKGAEVLRLAGRPSKALNPDTFCKMHNVISSGGLTITLTKPNQYLKRKKAPIGDTKTWSQG